MTDHEFEGAKPADEDRVQRGPVESGGTEGDPVAEGQQGKGYGEDEGERDQSIDRG